VKPVPGTVEAPPAKVAPSLPAEVGIYARRGEQWIEIQPEIVTYHTSGIFARLATAGAVQNDVNGRVKGAHSRNVLQAPLEFLIVAAEGVAITEYQLFQLRGQRDNREFLSVIGGFFSSSGGATRDLLQFESAKLQSRAFSIKMARMAIGEYGFLLGGAASPGKEGKMYTFRVVE
jgi:hypothetical protein